MTGAAVPSRLGAVVSSGSTMPAAAEVAPNIGVPGYALSPPDAVTVLNHQGPYNELDVNLRKRVCTAMKRSAAGAVLAAWNDSARDSSGALRLNFLKNWAADPTCGWLRIIESQKQRTAQSVKGVWEYKTYSAVLAEHSNNERVATKLCNSAPRRLPHPQDPNDPELTLYMVFTALKVSKAEVTEQERRMELETGVEDAEAAAFGEAALQPTNMASSVPGPLQYGTPVEGGGCGRIPPGRKPPGGAKPAKGSGKGGERPRSQPPKLELSAIDKELDAHKRRAGNMLSKAKMLKEQLPKDGASLDKACHDMLDQMLPDLEGALKKATDFLSPLVSNQDKEVAHKELSEVFRKHDPDLKSCSQRQTTLAQAAKKASAPSTPASSV